MLATSSICSLRKPMGELFGQVVPVGAGRGHDPLELAGDDLFPRPRTQEPGDRIGHIGQGWNRRNCDLIPRSIGYCTIIIAWFALLEGLRVEVLGHPQQRLLVEPHGEGGVLLGGGELVLDLTDEQVIVADTRSPYAWARTSAIASAPPTDTTFGAAGRHREQPFRSPD